MWVFSLFLRAVIFLFIFLLFKIWLSSYFVEFMSLCCSILWINCEEFLFVPCFILSPTLRIFFICLFFYLFLFLPFKQYFVCFKERKNSFLCFLFFVFLAALLHIASQLLSIFILMWCGFQIFSFALFIIILTVWVISSALTHHIWDYFIFSLRTMIEGLSI